VRSLAPFLCYPGKKAVILDCNLSAPILPRLFCDSETPVKVRGKRGLLEYLFFYQDVGQASNEIHNYVLPIRFSGSDEGELFFMPATKTFLEIGPTLDCLGIDWKKLYPDKGMSSGVALLLHLRDLLQGELGVDLLVIDAGAGLSHLSVTCLKRLADTVICPSRAKDVRYVKEALLKVYHGEEDIPELFIQIIDNDPLHPHYVDDSKEDLIPRADGGIHAKEHVTFIRSCIGLCNQYRKNTELTLT
jgi:hypothetical protein